MKLRHLRDKYKSHKNRSFNNLFSERMYFQIAFQKATKSSFEPFCCLLSAASFVFCFNSNIFFFLSAIIFFLASSLAFAASDFLPAVCSFVEVLESSSVSLGEVVFFPAVTRADDGRIGFFFLVTEVPEFLGWL